ncbi:hypothetical protein [Streptomyces purpureus]|uniref:Lipoprotein n=1 Tax=Streptomyces purpureus TaxID=1951 RepID=A0A918H7S2_9ACTN|nr:hypothetical protein [Streptomyces purpureus]GGT39738.1 lipoprotein [Streptomyces purpureus]
MASQRRILRTATAVATAAATAVCTAVIVGAAPAAGSQALPLPAYARAAAPTPSPDPFKDLSADEIGDRAVEATQSATSLRMSGRGVSDGQTLDLDFSVNDQAQCTGKLTVEGGVAELRQAGGDTYMKGDEKFWRASMTSQGMPEAQIGPTIELLKGRWLKIAPGQEGSTDLAGVCDLKALLADLGKDEDDRTGLTRGADTKVNDTPVATLVKKKADGETTTVYVAKEGKPYIVQIVKKGGDEPGTMLLSDFDKPVKVVLPPADETVDLEKLERGTAV